MRLRPLLLVILFTCGCGAKSNATLIGTVTMNGQALKKGNISLTPTEGGGGTAGGTIQDGKVTVANLMPGKYRVQITGVPDGPIIMPNSPEAKVTYTPAQIRAMADPIPADTEGNNEEIDIKAGEQSREFKLTSKSAGR